ncbi:MAG: cytochrome b/b6 domain-containing protein [Nitrospirae bacterium]|nr:cytochrome b/b6 domain-containing protein [Nitrospirota bacterium]
MRQELLENKLPLTEEERGELKSKSIKKHTYTTIWFHWFNALTWLLLLPTGAALINSDKYNFIPLELTQIISSIFQGRENLLKFHIWFGILWTVVMFYAVFGARVYLPVIKSAFLLDRDDLQWFKHFINKIRGVKGEEPPQGFFNAGQKLFAVNFYLMLPVIMITGVVMYFQLLPPFFLRWAILGHFISVGTVAIGLPVHIFMAGFYAPERSAFTSMFTGKLNEYFAYKHNYKWWREAKKKSLEQSDSSH